MIAKFTYKSQMQPRHTCYQCHTGCLPDGDAMLSVLCDVGSGQKMRWTRGVKGSLQVELRLGLELEHALLALVVYVEFMKLFIPDTQF